MQRTIKKPFLSKCFQCAWNQAKSRKLNFCMWSRNHQNNVFLHFNGLIKPIQTISSYVKSQYVIGGHIDEIAEKRGPKQWRHDGHNIYHENGWIEIGLKISNDRIASVNIGKERRKRVRMCLVFTCSTMYIVNPKPRTLIGKRENITPLFTSATIL